MLRATHVAETLSRTVPPMRGLRSSPGTRSLCNHELKNERRVSYAWSCLSPGGTLRNDVLQRLPFT